MNESTYESDREFECRFESLSYGNLTSKRCSERATITRFIREICDEPYDLFINLLWVSLVGESFLEVMAYCGPSIAVNTMKSTF